MYKVVHSLVLLCHNFQQFVAEELPEMEIPSVSSCLIAFNGPFFQEFFSLLLETFVLPWHFVDLSVTI